MPFPLNWTVDRKTAEPLNVSPCWVDIIGFDNIEEEFATYHHLPDKASGDEFIYFRIRLNGNPLTGIPRNPIENSVWGVGIKDINNSWIFMSRMNGVGNREKLEILLPTSMAGTVIFQQDVILNTNIQVSYAGTETPCPDNPQDYFLDLRFPRDKFEDNGVAFDFYNETYKFCYYTSQNPNNVNKEQQLCGPLLNPPIDKPYMNEEKRIVGDNPIKVNQLAEWTVTNTIENPSLFKITDVVSNDTIINPETRIKSIKASKGEAVEVVPNEVKWDNFELDIGETATLEVVLEGAFDSTGYRFLDPGDINGEWSGGTMEEVRTCDCGIYVMSAEPNRGIDLFAEIE